MNFPIIRSDNGVPPQASPGTGTGERGSRPKGTGDPVLGAKLRYMRELRRLPLKAAASKAGVTTGTLSDYEHGRVMPGVRVLVRLYRLYGVYPSYLIDHLADEDPAA